MLAIIFFNLSSQSFVENLTVTADIDFNLLQCCICQKKPTQILSTFNNKYVSDCLRFLGRKIWLGMEAALFAELPIQLWEFSRLCLCVRFLQRVDYLF